MTLGRPVDEDQRDRFFVEFQEAGAVTGYAVYRIVADPVDWGHRTMRLVELCAATPISYRPSRRAPVRSTSRSGGRCRTTAACEPCGRQSTLSCVWWTSRGLFRPGDTTTPATSPWRLPIHSATGTREPTGCRLADRMERRPWSAPTLPARSTASMSRSTCRRSARSTSVGFAPLVWRKSD